MALTKVQKEGIETLINNNADNRVITGSGTANTLNGESTLTWNGTLLDINQSGTVDTGLKLRNSEGGLYVRANDDKTFIDTDQLIIRNEAETERMRIDSSGRVGINQTSFATVDTMLSISELTGHVEMGLISKNDSNCAYNFGDPEDYNIGRIKYAHSDNSMQFDTNGSERMRIDSSGNLGIGDSSPSELLSLKNTNAQCQQSLTAATNGSCAIYFGDTDSVDRSKILHHNNGDYLSFSTAAAERMRIISSGFLKAKGNSSTYQSVGSDYHELVGDTAHDVVAKIKHNSSTGYGLQMQLNHGNGGLYAFNLRNIASGLDNCFIRGDGDLENVNNSYGGTSDIKLKENIVDAKSQWNDIKALKVRNFNYKADENKTKFIGLVAQEAETVCPSLVKSQPDLGENNEDLGTETKVLKYSILYMKAIKALQEAQARIETLETKVAALEAG